MNNLITKSFTLGLISLMIAACTGQSFETTTSSTEQPVEVPEDLVMVGPGLLMNKVSASNLESVYDRIKAEPNGKYALVEDITITEPIAEFYGVLDGQGYTMYVDIPESTEIADLAPILKLGVEGQIRNLKVVLSNPLKGKGAVAGLVAKAYGSIVDVEVSGAAIQNSFSYGATPEESVDTERDQGTGGVVGSCYGCLLENVTTQVDVQGIQSVGGMIGYMYFNQVVIPATDIEPAQYIVRTAAMESGNYQGAVQGAVMVGGLVGGMNVARINNSTATVQLNVIAKPATLNITVAPLNYMPVDGTLPYDGFTYTYDQAPAGLLIGYISHDVMDYVFETVYLSNSTGSGNQTNLVGFWDIADRIYPYNNQVVP